MTEPSQSYNIRAIRELLQTGFTVEDLRGLFSFAMCQDLRPVADEFTPEDSKPAMVRKAVEYCRSRFLVDELLAEIKDANPRVYERFEPELFVPSAEQPQEEEQSRPTPEVLTISSPIYLDLVRIPAGEFLMGSVAARDEYARENELPPHPIHVPEFHIGQYPVTNQQYQAFVKAAGRKATRWEYGGIPSGKENYPVANISWEDALAYCAWLSQQTGWPFRLPTEAEWEKAARGTDGRIYPWGDEPPDESRCNFGKQIGDTTPIGLFSPQGDSPCGCTDMAGNVSEWCQSLNRPYPYRAGDGREDLQAPGGRVVRGGSFCSDHRDVRCAVRDWFIPHLGNFWQGFRIVLAPSTTGL